MNIHSLFRMYLTFPLPLDMERGNTDLPPRKAKRPLGHEATVQRTADTAVLHGRGKVTKTLLPYLARVTIYPRI